MEDNMSDPEWTQQQAHNKNKKQVGKGQENNRGQKKNNNNNNRQQSQNQQGHQGGNKLQKQDKKPQVQDQQISSQDSEKEKIQTTKVVYEKKLVEKKDVEQPESQQVENSSDSMDNQKQHQKGEKRENKQNFKKEAKDEDQNQQQNQNKVKNDGKPQGICRLYKAGKCFYGDKCKFRHGKVKVGLEKLCKLFLDQGKCKFDKKCHFVHMTMEEWEQKYRHSKNPNEKEDLGNNKDISSDDDDDDVSDEEKEKFEYKSKMQIKKEKAERLAQEHKARKEFVANNDKNSTKKNVTFINSQPTQVKDTKVPGVEYFDPEDFDKDLNMMQQVSQASNQVEAEKNEKPWFDMDMIEALKQKKEVQNPLKFKSWIDYSKTEQGKLTAELNNRLLFKNDYAGFVKSLKENYLRDLAQIMRQYMSSFKWIQKNHMFEIFFTPTCKKENLPINFDIIEGYFRLRIALDVKGAGANTQYQILNTSIPQEITDQLDDLLNNIHQSQGKSIFRTLKYFDNNMEKVFVGAHDLIKLQKDREEEEERLKQEEEERKKLLEQKKLEEGDNEGNEGEGEDDNPDEDEDDYDYDEGEDYDEVEEDPYFNQNDEENKEESSDEQEAEEEKKDPTVDLDLNMHCSLKDLQMRRIAHLRVQSLIVSVKCKSCKYDTELTLCNYLDGSGESVLVNNLICVSCNRMAAIYSSREFVCSTDLNLVFRLGSFTWHILDIRQVSYVVTCEGCNSAKIVENYVTGTNHSSDCHSCFKNLSFIYFGFNIEKKIDHEYLAKKKSNKVKEPSATASMRPKKVGTFKQGEPLPKNGACSHYRHSCRFFRFPCCGKAFPCDLCHDQSEKHEQIRAKTMICGYCSKEQSIKQECSGCQKLLVRISSNSGYWEGGKGTRNQQSMSSRDSHKFTGLSKTVSRRKIKKENMQKK
ncbi:hypothetical protein ABPG72_011878 [Tetrahymena utriculariae]